MLNKLTKFSPDHCFGIFKKAYSQRFVSLLCDIGEVGTNIHQLVGLSDGTTIVPMYDWQMYFTNHVTNIRDINKYHYFPFNKIKLGIVTVKKFAQKVKNLTFEIKFAS